MFDYADIIWGDMGNVASLEQLQALQNKAAHIILDLPLVHQPVRLEINLGGNCSQEDVLSIVLAMFRFKCQNNVFTHSSPLIPFPLKPVPHRLSQPVYLFTLFNIYMYQAIFIFWWLMN